MLRTLNYTGRTKILQNQALFSFKANTSSAPEFQVKFDIDPADFPADAMLYVEAYYKETRQRFSFGTLTNLRPPPRCRLDEIDLSGPTSFRVLVVDESNRNAMLLASGDQFRAETDDDDSNKSSILPVRQYPMGQLPWRIHFEQGSSPELHLNSQIPNVIVKMRSDPIFQSLMLPAVLREILTYYLWNDEDSDGDIHCDRWMSYAELLAEARPKTEDPVELHRWVEDVVEAFSSHFELTKMLLGQFEGDIA